MHAVTERLCGASISALKFLVLHEKIARFQGDCNAPTNHRFDIRIPVWWPRRTPCGYSLAMPCNTRPVADGAGSLNCGVNVSTQIEKILTVDVPS